jgi:predicted anti-sigma-YlaC factor YlaD
MRCTDVRAALPLLIYGEPSVDDVAVKEHLAKCPDCRRELEALQGVRRMLDFAPVPHVAVDMAQLQRSVADRQLRRERNWRRAAMGLGGIAAVLLLTLSLRLELRLEANQLVVRWSGTPVGQTIQPDHVVSESQAGKPDLREDLRVLSDLIHALKQDADERDQRYAERLDRLQKHVIALQSQGDLRWDTTEKDVAALYLLTHKGEKP